MIELRMALYELAQLRKKISPNDKIIINHIKNVVNLLSELAEELQMEENKK